MGGRRGWRKFLGGKGLIGEVGLDGERTFTPGEAIAVRGRG